ncbi:hypothetical protein VDGL01_08999 [Verticillium dahliae]
MLLLFSLYLYHPLRHPLISFSSLAYSFSHYQWPRPSIISCKSRSAARTNLSGPVIGHRVKRRSKVFFLSPGTLRLSAPLHGCTPQGNVRLLPSVGRSVCKSASLQVAAAASSTLALHTPSTARCIHLTLRLLHLHRCVCTLHSALCTLHSAVCTLHRPSAHPPTHNSHAALHCTPFPSHYHHGTDTDTQYPIPNNNTNTNTTTTLAPSHLRKLAGSRSPLAEKRIYRLWSAAQPLLASKLLPLPPSSCYPRVALPPLSSVMAAS